MFLNLQRNKNFCIFLSLIFKLISAVRQGDAAREDLWIIKILRYIIFFLNFLCFNDFYNKFLQYAKEIAQEDIGLFNNFALLTKKIFHCLLYSIFVYNVFLQYAKETQHEKILRGLALGIALTMYGRLEEADALIDSLCLDKDPILRWSGMFTLAMAYCGSGSNQAIRKLLHVAVSQSLYLFQSLFFCIADYWTKWWNFWKLL